MRQGKESYSRKYEEALKLSEAGLSTKQVAEKLGVSFSAAYAWTKKGRKPEPGQLNEFADFLKENGPQPLLEVVKRFPKHSELFLTARQRRLPVARRKLPKIMGQYALWYYIKGQEPELEARMKEVIDRRQQLKNEFISRLDLAKLA
jgi:transcriptional regulator with XRE-family HTH domain